MAWLGGSFPITPNSFTFESFPTHLPNSSSSRVGIPGRESKGRPYPLFSPPYIEDLAAPRQQHLWPRLGLGAGEAELRRGKMCGGSLPLLSLLLPLCLPTPKLGAGPGSSDWLGDGQQAPPLPGAGFHPALHQDSIKGARAGRRSRREFLLGVGAGGTRSVRPRMSGR